METEFLKGHLDLLLLAIVAQRPRHGYAVISSLRQGTEGIFDLSEGTVYPVLHRLQDNGLLASDWEEVAGRRRRVYRLTDAGGLALAAGDRRWRGLAAAVDAVLRARPDATAGAVLRPRPGATGGALA
jgi:DNA-binding PadR family transcriptional regulator